LLLKATSDNALEKLKGKVRNKKIERKIEVVRKRQVEREREIKTSLFN
jgi:hypothetical protein